ncbi:MAG TPA: DUF4432 family protein [Devosiaceae bacterium]|nr:DUF4432 family protein [Devosiaceae bacterium]
MKIEDIAAKVGDLRQFASVRQIVLDDGPERGVRALLFSSGGGFDFLVTVDRSLDIGTLHYKGTPMAWQSAQGLRSPFLTDVEGEAGRGFDRSFSGLLATTGLDHILQADGKPLHGRLPFSPARLRAYGEDWDREEPVLYCEGDIIQAAYGKENLKLTRRIEAPIGGTSLRIFDRVENNGPVATPHAVLYHINFGYPAIADGSLVTLGETAVWPAIGLADAEMKPQVKLLPSPAGIEAGAAISTGGERPLRVAVGFSPDTLPYVQFWKDLRPRVGVLAVEPCSHGRNADGTPAGEAVLQPGESRSYRLTIAISDGA